MPETDVNSILKLEVPVIVRLAHRKMKLNEVLNLQPGSMVDLPKMSDEPLDLMVNNKLVGHGSAVKVGENFGLKITVVGDAAERIKALGPEAAAEADDD
jgi:flagellar motor switch protein FliN/FliY